MDAGTLHTAGQGFNWIICNTRPPFSNPPPAPRAAAATWKKKKPVLLPLLCDILAADGDLLVLRVDF